MADIAAVASNAGGRVESGRARLVQSYETFLSLLTTQLKNQDPTAPLDTNQFTQQLVQMTGVEQQLLTNDLLKSLAEKASDGLTGAVGYIGKTVRAETPAQALAEGKAAWTYELPSRAAEVTLEVLNAKGQVVFRKEGDLSAGEHGFNWDGKDLQGDQLPDGGVYSLRVTAVDAAEAKTEITVTTSGVVKAVEQVEGESVLLLNGVGVPLTAVRQVRQPS
jgi:flagellar basal-body rod modification protein FlgD